MFLIVLNKDKHPPPLLLNNHLPPITLDYELFGVFMEYPGSSRNRSIIPWIYFATV